MMLEAAEDEVRGFGDPSRSAKAGSRVSRVGYPIEHVLPQRWSTHWPVSDPLQKLDRDAHVHRLGNLTLLTESLNASVSNGSWDAKRAAFDRHDVMLLNRDLVRRPDWDEAAIDDRTTRLTESLLRTWPAPEGHLGVEGVQDRGVTENQWADLRVLVAEGAVPEGTVLRGRGQYAEARATVRGDGTLLVGDGVHTSPSGAARAAREGKDADGWWFWLLDDGRSLRDIWRRRLRSTPDEVVDADPG